MIEAPEINRKGRKGRKEREVPFLSVLGVLCGFNSFPTFPCPVLAAKDCRKNDQGIGRDDSLNGGTTKSAKGANSLSLRPLRSLR